MEWWQRKRVCMWVAGRECATGSHFQKGTAFSPPTQHTTLFRMEKLIKLVSMSTW